jgi:2-phospho-L-lactate/phosphoenolpyruvate guanylyltransferase
MRQDRGVQAWLAVLPVKPLDAAKTRLRGAVPGVPHDRLVLAMALDTVAAVLACPAVAGVTVVTADPAVAAAVAALGARCVADAPAAGLNAALALGSERALAGDPGRTGVVALTADLPALRPAELTAALRAAARHDAPPPPAAPSTAAPSTAAPSTAAPSTAGPGGSGWAAQDPGGRAFVADAAGTGTVLLAALHGRPLQPRFGPGSAAAHAAGGAVRLDGDWPGLRRDVDTALDLAAARALGVGRHTRELLHGARYGVPSGGRPPASAEPTRPRPVRPCGSAG